MTNTPLAAYALREKLVWKLLRDSIVIKSDVRSIMVWAIRFVCFDIYIYYGILKRFVFFYLVKPDWDIKSVTSI